MYNTALNVADFGFETLERIERFDYVRAREVFINFSITAVAIIHAVLSYAITAFLCWWDTHGERVVVNTLRFTFNFIDTIGATYYAGVNLRPVVNHWVATLTDGVYYLATGV